jgi:periplasmic protein TonB
MPDSQFFRSLSALLAGATLVFGMLVLLEIASRLEFPGHRPIASFDQVQVILDVTAGSPYTRASSVHADRAPSNNEPALQLVGAGPGLQDVTLQDNPDEESGAGQNVERDALADLDEVAAIHQKHAREEGEPVGGFEEIGLAEGAEQTAALQVTETNRVPYGDELQTQEPVRTVVADRYPEKSTDTVTETGALPEEIGLEGGAEQTAAPRVIESKRAPWVDGLQTQEPVRTVVADRYPEKSTNTVTEAGALSEETGLAEGAEQTAALQATETNRVPYVDELQAQEPVRIILANRYPEHTTLAKTQALQMDGEAPAEPVVQTKAARQVETDSTDFGGSRPAKSQTSAAKGKSRVSPRQQDTVAAEARQKEKPDTSSRALQQKKSSASPPRWKAMSLGSATEAPQTKAKTGRMSSKDYNMRVWSSIARHKPKVGRKGSTTVTFGVGSNGMLRGARVSRSSGDARLDSLAIATVRKAAPFPKPPAGLGPQSFTVSIYFR